MSELILVKQPLLVTNENVHGEPVPIEKVVAVTPTNGVTISEFGHVYTGEEQEEILTLPDVAVDSLVEFYKQTRAQSPDKRPEYSCHTFTYFTLGAVATIGLPKYFETSKPERHWRINRLVSGQAYMTRNRQGVYNHSTLGINRPAFNLCTAGNNRPLCIYSNRDIMRMYDAKSIYGYRPTSMTLQN